MVVFIIYERFQHEGLEVFGAFTTRKKAEKAIKQWYKESPRDYQIFEMKLNEKERVWL